MASGIAGFIVADDAFVYWTDGASIYSAPVAGGTGSLLATGMIGRLALDEFGALYWVLMRDFQGGKGSLHRMQNRIDAKGNIKSTEVKTYEVLEIYGEQVERLIEMMNTETACIAAWCP